MLIQGALSGLAIGGVFAVMAVCLTLMARLVRVINFAQGAVGMFGAFTASAIVQLGFSNAVATSFGILTGGMLSVLIGIVLSLFMPETSIASRSAVTVSALLLILSFSYVLFGTSPMPFRPIVSGASFEIGGIVIGNITVVMIAAAVAIASLAKLLLTFTTIGMRLRAIADRPVTAELLGMNVKALTLTVWLVSGLLTTSLVVMIAPVQTSDALSLSMLVIPSAAAALLGGFLRLDVALAGGLMLGMTQGIMAQAGEWGILREWVPLLTILVLLLWGQRKEVWDEAR